MPTLALPQPLQQALRKARLISAFHSFINADDLEPITLEIPIYGNGLCLRKAEAKLKMQAEKPERTSLKFKKDRSSRCFPTNELIMPILK